mgnify:CR=1 FL=1
MNTFNKIKKKVVLEPIKIFLPLSETLIYISSGNYNLFLLLLKLGIRKFIQTEYSLYEEIVYLDILPALKKISSHYKCSLFFAIFLC